MNYTKIYYDFMKSRQQLRKLHTYGRVPKEDKRKYHTHHILPKSLGGTDNADNLVRLTVREHFLAHFLLYKIDKKNNQAFLFLVQNTCKVKAKVSGEAYAQPAWKCCKYKNLLKYIDKAKYYDRDIAVWMAAGHSAPRKSYTCPHCSKEGRGGNMKRYHFDNCKRKPNEA